MTNDYLRDKAIATSERHIAYLKQQAAATDMVGVKQAIYGLMEREINKEMLARGTEEYALNVIDPAQAPEIPSSPRPILWTIAGTLFGVLLSLLVAIAAPAGVNHSHQASAQHDGGSPEPIMSHARVSRSPPS